MLLKQTKQIPLALIISWLFVFCFSETQQWFLWKWWCHWVWVTHPNKQCESEKVADTDHKPLCCLEDHWLKLYTWVTKMILLVGCSWRPPSEGTQPAAALWCPDSDGVVERRGAAARVYTRRIVRVLYLSVLSLCFMAILFSNVALFHVTVPLPVWPGWKWVTVCLTGWNWAISKSC